ncbi:4-hydroxy-2-oxovalerate aldolase [Bacillus benzoevorans]|uniref:4-hydroxy-2-oxovalerate aldolase n=1 Tax=Bacillus benzoevorans TaxID=1456 RepID=A0A7X0HY23_9BACI|nr:4-hydroxy-2-oxovalerate aldolase [Bacillus benzoevorans]MBB6447711.1 4-hydroxy 2-oxovalerate aldolase [Bacillus benzoevorans]
MTIERDIQITEVALRDGSHAVRHQYTVEQVQAVTKGLADAGVPYIEVTHGDGLAGSSLQYGLSKVSDIKLIEAAADVAGDSKIAVLLLPGIGTIEDLKEAASVGAKMVRVATHVTEADVAPQHIAMGKELGMEAVGFLMMSHMAPVEKLIEQAKLMESYGADIVYMTDSAGYLLPEQVTERIGALRQELQCEIGFHGHNNLSMAMANSIAAIKAGATRIDGSLRCFGAGAGNTQTEVLAAVCDRMGIKTGIDLYKIQDLAEDIVAPLLPVTPTITREAITLGYAGVYSTFAYHAKRAAAQFGVDARDVLVELARRQVVGGQEDMIIDVAAELAARQGVAAK